MREARGGPWFMPIMGGLIGTAWVALLLWEQSPYGRYLDHGRWNEIGLLASLCRALPAGEVLVPALLYVGGWLLMSAAMMLPTIMPLLDRFARLTRSHPNSGTLVALLIAGYLSVWAGFGVAAHLLDAALNAVVSGTPALAENGWMLGAAIIAGAGLFQFSRLKYMCLDKCRTPFSFIAHHWQGAAARRRAFLLGLDHGLFCVGCCWATMLLMFIVGTGNVGWMLVLGSIMALEKNALWGRRIARPVGGALLLWAGAITATNL